MTRNQLIKLIGNQIDYLIVSSDAIPARQNKINSLSALCDDLCNVPCMRNRKNGVICYTIKQAEKSFKEIVKREGK